MKHRYSIAIIITITSLIIGCNLPQFNNPKMPVNTLTQDGYMISGFVAGNGINGIAWKDIGAEALNHGYTKKEGIQPSDLAATYRAIFGAGKVSEYSDVSKELIYDSLKSNKAVIVYMLVTSIDEGKTYKPSTIGDNSFSQFARVIGMDWDKQDVHIQNTLSGENTWILSVNDLKQSMYDPGKRAQIKPSESIDPEKVNNWGITIDQDK